MERKPNYFWALAVGVLFPVSQIVIDLIRLGSLNPEMSAFDYLMLLLAGLLTGAGLLYFLRRSTTRGVRLAALIGFVIGLPFAFFGMVLGAMVGGIGIVLLSVSPVLFITGIGYFIGGAFAKK